MKNKITILGEKFERTHIPKVSRMFETSQSNAEQQIQSIADAWHKGNISSAVVALESDLGPEDSSGDKDIQLPDELSHWFNRQVYLMRDLNKTVLIITKNQYETLREKIISETQTKMSDKPRMARFLLSGIVKGNITDKGILHLPESFVRYTGDGTYKFEETARGVAIKAENQSILKSQKTQKF